MFYKKYLILFIASLVVLLCLAHIPQDEMPNIVNIVHVDKLLHMIAYGGVTVLLLLAIRPGRKLSFRFFAFALLLTLGAVDEYTQSFVGRSSSVADWIADIVGMIVAVLFVRLILRKKQIADS